MYPLERIDPLLSKWMDHPISMPIRNSTLHTPSWNIGYSPEWATKFCMSHILSGDSWGLPKIGKITCVQNWKKTPASGWILRMRSITTKAQMKVKKSSPWNPSSPQSGHQHLNLHRGRARRARRALCQSLPHRQHLLRHQRHQPRVHQHHQLRVHQCHRQTKTNLQHKAHPARPPRPALAVAQVRHLHQSFPTSLQHRRANDAMRSTSDDTSEATVRMRWEKVMQTLGFTRFIWR